MADRIEHTDHAIGRRGYKENNPDRWCATVELPGGLVAYAHYNGTEPWAFGVAENSTLDEVTRRQLRRMPDAERDSEDEDRVLEHAPEFVEGRREADEQIAAGDLGTPLVDVMDELEGGGTTVSRCAKRRYHDRVAALLALARAQKKDGARRAKTEARVYECPRCRGWHLTSEERRS